MKHRKRAGTYRHPAGFDTGQNAGGCRINGRLWMEREGETYLAWGRIVLLERIGQHGSISAAARSMGMGYRHAWGLVDALNRMAPAPLVEMSTGGTRGGGARLTPAGQAAIEEFWSLAAAFRAWLRQRQPRFAEGARKS